MLKKTIFFSGLSYLIYNFCINNIFNKQSLRGGDILWKPYAKMLEQGLFQDLIETSYQVIRFKSVNPYGAISFAECKNHYGRIFPKKESIRRGDSLMEHYEVLVNNFDRFLSKVEGFIPVCLKDEPLKWPCQPFCAILSKKGKESNPMISSCLKIYKFPQKSSSSKIDLSSLEIYLISFFSPKVYQSSNNLELQSSSLTHINGNLPPNHIFVSCNFPYLHCPTYYQGSSSYDK